ncbi:hypothetical protein [Oricola cellulosilytica]|uniref:hypothetical protein n=1 Tax=Oricola cellulosilytica TaxID=1429082 RepID=UPI001304F5E4|nr:hypothetical protein [Oricola cellulosilytica]
MESLTRKAARIACLASGVLAVTSCTGTESDLGIKRDLNDGSSAAFPNITEAAPLAQPATGLAANDVAVQVGKVYFAPIVGAPVDKVSALSARLGPAGSANGVKLVASTDPDRTHEIKGYFSAFTEGDSTTVVHVWDVISPSGQRIHRIQGQEVVSGKAAEPWASVPDTTMQAIADKVITEYAAWRRSDA